MKKYLLFICLCLVSYLSSAQVGEWVWLHGDSTGNDFNYGIEGVPSPANLPPGFYEPIEWTDLNGNFWFYGGVDRTLFNTFAALWKYDPKANEWTWVSGTNFPNDPGSYGTQGIPSPNNHPPARGWGGASWVDANNDLWMFGGSDITGKYQDLWKYDISTNEWTWMSGPATSGGAGVYGTKGIPNAANLPPSRDEAAATWTLPSGSAGDLWLFGGSYQYLATLNDLWRFNIATNTWTWMNGSDIVDQIGTYGTQGVENSVNTPGGRRVYCKWKDNNNNLWLFGGWDDYNDIYYNDLWRYNPVTNKWAWMNGSSIGNVGGFYGTKCVMSPANQPGSRYEDRVSWTDKSGNFWMFGGGHDYFYDNFWSATWNDLWKYCVVSNQWVWVSGDTIPNQKGNFGKIGIASPSNKPVPVAGAVGWYSRDSTGAEHLYVWGGSDSSEIIYNDVWKYTIDSVCGACTAALPVVFFQSNDSSICEFGCINFTDLSTNATSWQWSFPGATPPSSMDENPQGICYFNAGSYDVTLIASDYSVSDTLTITGFIKVYPSPPTPAITQVHTDTLFCSTDSSYSSYQWYFNDTLIAGAKDTFLVVTKDGNYNVSVTNKNGCQVAVGINVVLGIYNTSDDDFISISPNPATSQLNIYVSSLRQSQPATIFITDVLGQAIILRPLSFGEGRGEAIDISGLSSGIYFVQVVGEKGRWVGKFVKE